MAEVKATSRNYSASPPHMSIVGGSFGQDRRGKPAGTLTPDRSGSQSKGRKITRRSNAALSGRSRVIVGHSGSSLAVRD